MLWLVCVIVNWLKYENGCHYQQNTSHWYHVDLLQGTINSNKRLEHTNTTFIRAPSAAHIIHQSIWIAPHIQTLQTTGQEHVGGGTIDSVTEVEFRIPPPSNCASPRAIMQTAILLPAKEDGFVKTKKEKEAFMFVRPCRTAESFVISLHKEN